MEAAGWRCAERRASSAGAERGHRPMDALDAATADLLRPVTAALAGDGAAGADPGAGFRAARRPRAAATPRLAANHPLTRSLEDVDRAASAFAAAVAGLRSTLDAAARSAAPDRLARLQQVGGGDRGGMVEEKRGRRGRRPVPTLFLFPFAPSLSRRKPSSAPSSPPSAPS